MCICLIEIHLTNILLFLSKRDKIPSLRFSVSWYKETKDYLYQLCLHVLNLVITMRIFAQNLMVSINHLLDLLIVQIARSFHWTWLWPFVLAHVAQWKRSTVNVSNHPMSKKRPVFVFIMLCQAVNLLGNWTIWF